ncbi:MAG: HDOD domain-containing protein [Myxococcales bacterium]|nr:HDOD domain-containing protein [Myxococcales bacterium]
MDLHDCEFGRRMRERLERGELELHPLPDIARRVLFAAGDVSSSAASLAKLVQQDPALASAVLRRANAAGLGAAAPATSVQHAIARLGTRRLSETAVALAMREGPFKGAFCQATLRRLWLRALASGLFAKELARTQRGNVERAFVAGLLWRVGEALALGGLVDEFGAAALPDEEATAELAASLGEAFTSAAVQSWRLPEALAAVIDTAREPGPEFADDRHIARLAHSLAMHPPEEPDAEKLHADADAVALGVYPEDLDAIWALAPKIREELESLG